MASINLKIMTPKGLYHQTQASIINMVTPYGQRGLLPNHMPIVCSLTISKLAIEEPQGRETYAIDGGVLYMKDNECTLLTSAIENVKDIDVERARAALERAQQRIANNSEGLDLRRAENALKRAQNRLKIVEEHS